jgi:hypothetical protein
MCNSNSPAWRLMNPGGQATAFMNVDQPEAKKPRTLSEAEKRRRAQERAVRAADNAKGGYGFSDTNKTGGTLGAPTATKKASLGGY